MSNRVHHPLSQANCNLAALRSDPTFSKFKEALEVMLQEIRDEYENNEASEYTRGRVQGIKEVLTQLSNQHIR